MLNTVHIDVPKMKTYLTWRGIFPVDTPVRVIELLMKRGLDDSESAPMKGAA